MSIYRRTKLAARMTDQLLHPGVLDEGLRSGLFLSGLRRIGKTTFLRNDLIPALEEAGALVIYVDLWTDAQINPATLVQDAIRKAIENLQSPASVTLKKVKRVGGADLAGFGFRFGFKLDAIGAAGGVTLAQALTEMVDQAKTDVVLIIDEVQHALRLEDGSRMLLALKAARDAINPRPGTPGHFLFIGVGSHRALVHELTTRGNQAFFGATSVSYRVLEDDYVEHLLDRLKQEGATALPSLPVAIAAFKALGHRPEEIRKALRSLGNTLPPGGDPDLFLPVIAATLRSTAADLELAKLEQMGGLATAIFERIASKEEARGIFSGEAAGAYSKAVGREVRIDEAQPVVNELMAANLIMRKAHGIYCVTDPFVQTIWKEKKALEEGG